MEKINLPVANILQTTLKKLNDSNASATEKAGAIQAAMSAILEFQKQLASINPAELERFNKGSKEKAQKARNIDEMNR